MCSKRVIEIEEIVPFSNPKYLDVKVTSKKIVDIIKAYDKSNVIEGIYIFGSRTKRKATKESDLDIGVFLNFELGLCPEHDIVEYRADISRELEKLIGYEVDFIPVFLHKGNSALEFDIASGLELYTKPCFREEVFEFKLNQILNNRY